MPYKVHVDYPKQCQDYYNINSIEYYQNYVYLRGEEKDVVVSLYNANLIEIEDMKNDSECRSNNL